MPCNKYSAGDAIRPAYLIYHAVDADDNSAFLAYRALSLSVKENIVVSANDEIVRQEPVIIAGSPRFGKTVNRLVRSFGFETVVLDNNIRKIDLMPGFGIKSFLGDPTRPVTLSAAELLHAQVLVVALDDVIACLKLVKLARQAQPSLYIIACAYDRGQVFALYNAGADDNVRETFGNSLQAGSYVLKNLGLFAYEAKLAEKIFYQNDREAMKNLAQRWDPKVPLRANTAYSARAPWNRIDREFGATKSQRPVARKTTLGRAACQRKEYLNEGLHQLLI